MNPKSQAPVTTREAILGQVLKKLRENRQIGQREMAKLVGVSQPYWSKVELGLANPSTEILYKSAEALSISKSQFFSAVEHAETVARNRGIQFIDAAQYKNFEEKIEEGKIDWLPILGIAALGVLVALALKNSNK